MSDGIDQALVDAGLGLLRADSSLVVHDGQVPNGAAPPYVVVYTTISRRLDDPENALDGQSRGITVRWYCHCVGGNAAAARAVGERVRTQLLNQRPTVTGVSCGLIQQDVDPLPPTRNESTGTVVMDAVHVYRMRAV